MNLFGPTEKAIFIKRLNRFVVLCFLNGKTIQAFLPNPGRLWELLLPGAVLYLEKSFQPERKLPYTVVAIEREKRPVMAHTHRTNDLVEHLLRKGLIPGLRGTEIIKREVQHGNSRFDFLLKKAEEEIYLEVKSCTLFGKEAAMFPDAVILGQPFMLGPGEPGKVRVRILGPDAQVLRELAERAGRGPLRTSPCGRPEAQRTI